MNVIVRLEFELAYYDSAVHCFNHYTTRTLPHPRIRSEFEPLSRYYIHFHTNYYHCFFLCYVASDIIIFYCLLISTFNLPTAPLQWSRTPTSPPRKRSPVGHWWRSVVHGDGILRAEQFLIQKLKWSRGLLPVRISSTSQIELFNHFQRIIIISYLKLFSKLFVLDRNTW